MSDFIKVDGSVSNNIIQAIDAVGSPMAYVIEHYKRVRAHDRFMYEFLVTVSDKLSHDHEDAKAVRGKLLTVGILIYRLLESQYEADELFKQWSCVMPSEDTDNNDPPDNLMPPFDGQSIDNEDCD